MKTSFTLLSIITAIVICSSIKAQNVFPSAGRVGIYTTSPAASLQVRGGARIGTTTNYTNIDSATGNLSFVGNAAYKVAGNKYAFQYSGNSNYGLFFNSTNAQYEFRNGSAVPVFFINANTGNSVFNGTLKVGAYTLPATDGTNGQVLKTNGSGVVTWSADNTGGSGSGWSLTGNAGTNATTNFIGTTDAQSLVFKVNNLRAGFIDYSTCCSGTRNTSFGQIALNSVTTGADNTATGYGVLYTNTTGKQNVGYGKYALFNNNADNNTALGFNAMFFNTTGANNTATGNLALQNNISGSNNTANGYGALTSNTTGDVNTANGYRSLYFNTTGEQNTATGYAALENNNGNYNSAHGTAALNNNTTGAWNTANGAYAMRLNATGYNNTATGGNALYSNIGGANNTAYGYNALYNNTADNNTAIGVTALYANTTGGGNIAIGLEALHFNTEGNDNIAIGQDALLFNTTGGDNIANGLNALYSNTTGSFNIANGINAVANNTTGDGNTADGYAALVFNETGSYNTTIGFNANFSSLNVNHSYSSAFGANATISASQQIRIGSTTQGINDPTSIGGKVDWSTLSDARVKKNIKENVPGLVFINKLKPITYTIDNDAINKILQPSVTKDKDGNTIKPSANKLAAGKVNAAIVYTGFAAQDVEKAANSLNYDFSGVDAAKNEHDLYGLRYAEFVVPLIKAVQELSKMNDDKDAKIDDLQKQIDELKAMIVSNQSSVNNQQSTVLSASSLEQNIPNPFTNSTTINYTLPQKFTNAQIVITDKNGKTLKSINVAGSGKGMLRVDAAILSSGAYQYALYVDGKLIASKQMILQK